MAGEAPASPQSAYVRSFNRYELKYLVDDAGARALALDLATHMTPDPHSGEEGYTVHSIYWDSPDFVFFWEKIEGEKYRRKLRFRRYEGASGESAFIEIKQRIAHTVQKRRVLWPIERIECLFGAGAIDSGREDAAGDAVAREALVLCRRLRLAPVVAIRYRRRAWFAAFEPDLRVTFDSRLMYDTAATGLRDTFDAGTYFQPPQHVVVEIKYNHRVPQWLIALVQKHGLEVRRFSKYCAAVDRAFFGGRYI
jgi:SPX domain protein involved in polyphosphate accumulation